MSLQHCHHYKHCLFCNRHCWTTYCSSTGDFIGCCNFILVVIMQSIMPSLGADVRILFYIPAWSEASQFCHAMPCSTKLEYVLMSYLSKKKCDQLKSRYRQKSSTSESSLSLSLAAVEKRNWCYHHCFHTSEKEILNMQVCGLYNGIFIAVQSNTCSHRLCVMCHYFLLQAFWRTCSFVLGSILERAFKPEYNLILHRVLYSPGEFGPFVVCIHKDNVILLYIVDQSCDLIWGFRIKITILFC